MELKIATTLKKIMKEKRISVKVLSRDSGVAVSTLHEWLNGRTPRDPVQAKKVADVLGVSLNRLLFDEADMSESINLNQILKQDIFSGVYEINIRKVKIKGEL
jgi:transcriptional regulator with XRE-family HTH domain